MHISFKQGLDKFDSKNYPNIEPEEIDLLLNQAQDTFVKQRYGFNNVSKSPFERDQKRIEDLKEVIVSDFITPQVNGPYNINANSVFAPMPQDHWITVQELANITRKDCNGIDEEVKGVYVQAIQHNDYSKLISNPFAKPTQDKVLRMSTKYGAELLHDPGCTINLYKIRYIKQPVRIDITNSVDCELSLMVHQEIINIAISIALENIEAERIKTFIQVVENKQE